jgi:hypothetical protein
LNVERSLIRGAHNSLVQQKRTRAALQSAHTVGGALGLSA